MVEACFMVKGGNDTNMVGVLCGGGGDVYFTQVIGGSKT